MGAGETTVVYCDNSAGTIVFGDLVQIREVLGMTQINSLTTAYHVNSASDTQIVLDVIYRTWGDYISGGTIKKVTNTITNLSHLEGKEIDILVDGAVHPRKTVSGGQVELAYYGNKIHAGLPYTSTLEPMKIHAGATLGTARGKKQKISSLTACFYESRGGKYGPDVDHLKQIPWGTGKQPELISDDVQLEFEGSWDNEATLCIVQDQPLPMTVIGIVPEVIVNER